MKRECFLGEEDGRSAAVVDSAGECVPPIALHGLDRLAEGDGDAG